MTDAIGGGNQPQFDPSADIEHIAEAGAESIQQGSDAPKVLKKITDSVVSMGKSDSEEDSSFLSKLKPDTPQLPPGKSLVSPKQLLEGGFQGADGVAKSLAGMLPKELKGLVGGDAGSGNPLIQGVNETISQVSNASAMATGFLGNIKNGPQNFLPDNFPKIPGAVNPFAGPLEQNVQVQANKAAILGNNKGMVEAQMKGMPDGPQKDSLMGYLAVINEAIANLEEFLSKMDEGVSKGSDYAYAVAQDSGPVGAAEEEKDEGGGPLSGMLDSAGLGAVGDMAGPLVGMADEVLTLGGLLDGFGSLLDGGLADGLKEIPVLGPLMEQFGLTGIMNNPALLLLVGSGVLMAATMVPVMGIWGALPIVISLAMAMLLSSEDNILKDTLENIPVVGDLVDSFYGPAQDMIDKFAFDNLLGGGKPPPKEKRERVRSRNAGGPAAASASAKAAGARHAAELDGASSEEAELKAQVAKLLSLLRSIASGNASPELLSDAFMGALGKITGSGGMENLLGGDASKLIEKALEAGGQGDNEGMIGFAMDAFGATPESLNGFTDALGSVIPNFNDLDDHFTLPSFAA